MFRNWILLIGSLERFLWRNKPQTLPSGSDGGYLFLRWFIYLSFWASLSPRRLNFKRDLHHACSNRLHRIKCDCLEMSKLCLEGLGIKIFWLSGNMTGIRNEVPKSYMIEVAAAFCLWQIVRKFHVFLSIVAILQLYSTFFKDSFLTNLSFIEVKYVIFRTC